MFAWKSMDDNSSLVKLKLDMVYRDLSMETASARFTESTRPVPPVTDGPAPAPKAKEPEEKKKPKKKVVKVAVPGPSLTRSEAMKAYHARKKAEREAARQ